ncbi:MAG: hypothetical protein ACE5DX_04525 [Candidatus Dojkabacteria bacterium]
MSNSLIKLIDYSLLPAALLLLGKIAGIYLVAAVFGITIGVQHFPEAIFSLHPVVPFEDLQTLSSYSDLIMFAIIAAGFSFVLVNAVFFHDSHIKVSTVNSLAKYNLLFLISSSFQLYHSGVIWFMFTWLANVAVLINMLAGKTYSWVVVLTTLFAIGLSVILFRDLSAELRLTRDKLLNAK